MYTFFKNEFHQVSNETEQEFMFIMNLTNEMYYVVLCHLSFGR